MGRSTFRRSWRCAGAVWAVLCGLLLLGVPAAAHAANGPRVTVGVYGDSVVEGYSIPNILRDSLIPQLRNGLVRLGGFERGGAGFIPFSPFRWTFSTKYTMAGTEPLRPDAWALAGNGLGVDGADGLSGFSGIAISPQAKATAPIDAPLVGLLFTKFLGSGVFTVTAGSRTFSIDARSSGPPTPAEQWITVPPDARTITVYGPSSGTLVFNGAIVRRSVTPGHIAVEVENLGHRGHRLFEDQAPRILAALRQQRFDISIFLSAIIWEVGEDRGGQQLEQGYADELRTRVGLIRGYGGLCLIVDPPPLPVAVSVVASFAAIDRRVALETGCAYSGVLTHLWDPATAAKTGMTIIDGFHPTASGYRLIAQALLPELVTLTRQRVRTRGF